MELYSHVPVMRDIVQALQRWGFMICGVFVLDSQFMADPGKFISGCLACLSAMVQLEIPHVNVMTKMDLVRKKRGFMERFYNPDMVHAPTPRPARLPAIRHPPRHALIRHGPQDELVAELNRDSNPRLFKLNEALGSLIEDYSLVGFVPLSAPNPPRVRAACKMGRHSARCCENSASLTRSLVLAPFAPFLHMRSATTSPTPGPRGPWP